MKANVVGDIRTVVGTPGCVEFNAAQRRIFYTCPCGCGSVGFLDMLKCYADRSGPTIYEMDFDQNEKPTMGEPMTIGIAYADGKIHWSGQLRKGEWYADEGFRCGHPDGLRVDPGSEGPSTEGNGEG